MRRFPVLATLLLLVAGPGFADSTQAPPNRVFVSARSGNDANPCNNILTPCQTLQGAVNQVAAGGEAIVLDSGGYGRVSIDKSVKIEAPPGVLAFIHPSSLEAIGIFAGASDVVVLRGLVLNVGSSEGIRVDTVGELHVENCVIDGFSAGINFTSPGKLFVLDTIIRNCSGAGITLTPNSGTLLAAIDHSRLDKNSTGLSVGGLGAVTVKASIKDSIAVGQGNVGLRADTSTGGVSELNVENCLVANNGGTGIFSFQNGGVTTVRVSNTTVTDNAVGINNNVGQILSRSNNTVEGNTANGAFSGTYTAK